VGRGCGRLLRLLAVAVVVTGAVQAESGLAVRAAARTSPADDELDRLLQRTREYVAQFTKQFTFLVGDEDYHQTLRDEVRERRRRHLESEVFFVGVHAGAGSLTVRSTRVVDGRPVEDSSDRIRRALADSSGEGWRRLRALADEGARYNLGALERNFNDPMLALLFAGPDVQSRFSFRIAGAEQVAGVAATRLAFRERERPTLIRDSRSGRDLPASGALVVAEDGTIWRTELHVETPGATAVQIRVSYVRDDRLGLLVPSVMDEDYRYRDAVERRMLFISGRAVYSNFRRFETSGRIVEPPPDR
jgi:hypothetical protein